MLGGDKLPKSVKEDAGYDRLLMEIRTAQDDSIVLERSLKKSGDFRVFRVALEEWSPDGEHEVMLAKNEPDNEDTDIPLPGVYCKRGPSVGGSRARERAAVSG